MSTAEYTCRLFNESFVKCICIKMCVSAENVGYSFSVLDSVVGV